MRTDGLREIAFTIRTVQKDGLRGAGLTKAHFSGVLKAVGMTALPEAADEIDRLRARIAELEAIVARDCREGQDAIEAVVAMDAERSGT